MAKTSNTPAQNVKEVNVITTRSGKQIEPSQTTTSSNKKDTPQSEDPKTLVRVPFPQALRSGKVLENQGEILEHLQQVNVNIPLLHVIKQVPAYAKVLKDLCTMKRRHHVKKTVFLIEQVSAVIEQKTPPKYKDPGCPTILAILAHNFSVKHYWTWEQV